MSNVSIDFGVATKPVAFRQDYSGPFVPTPQRSCLAEPWHRGTVALWTPSVPGPSVRDPEECRFTQLITLTPFLLGYFQGLQL